jgi:hypothetical protein
MADEEVKQKSPEEEQKEWEGHQAELQEKADQIAELGYVPEDIDAVLEARDEADAAAEKAAPKAQTSQSKAKSDG